MRRVDVFDSLAAPPAASDAAWGAGERSYQLGLNGRGQKALRAFDCMERVDKWSARVNGRLSFATPPPGGGGGGDGDGDGAPLPFSETRLKPPGTPGAEKEYVTRVLQRDRLQACLLEELAAAHGAHVRVTHGVACVGVDLAGERPTLDLRPCVATTTPAPREGVDVDPDGCDVSESGATRETYDLVVGADGVQSSVRDALVATPGSTTRAVRFPDDNERRCVGAATRARGGAAWRDGRAHARDSRRRRKRTTRHPNRRARRRHSPPPPPPPPPPAAAGPPPRGHTPPPPPKPLV